MPWPIQLLSLIGKERLTSKPGCIGFSHSEFVCLKWVLKALGLRLCCKEKLSRIVVQVDFTCTTYRGDNIPYWILTHNVHSQLKLFVHYQLEGNSYRLDFSSFLFTSFWGIPGKEEECGVIARTEAGIDND